MFENRLSAVVLSRGSTWQPRPQDPPYLMADPLRAWPDNAVAYARFYDTTGAQLVDDIDGEVTPSFINFAADPDVVDLVPNGANFDITLDTNDGPFQIRHGKVIRREVEFFDSPGLTTKYQALRFTDTFPTLGLRSSWKAVAGRTKVFNNAPSSLPNGVGPNVGLLFAASAIRWYAPLNGNSVRVNVSLLNQGTGKARVILCADQRFSSGLAVEFEESAHRIHFGKVTGPTTVTYLGSAIVNTVADNDNYTIVYNEATDTISVYKGTSTTPLGSYTDSLHAIPHGPGYTHLGLSWSNSGLLSQGIQCSYFSAAEGV